MKHISDLSRYGLFDARVPRFTSYPPANWFSEGVDAEHVRTWQYSALEDAEISLYVHIPFCRRLCWFCACRTQGTRSDAPLAPYVDRVLAEARDVRAGFVNGVTPKRLHLGGGTPTILSPELLDKLLSGACRHSRNSRSRLIQPMLALHALPSSRSTACRAQASAFRISIRKCRRPLAASSRKP